MFDVITIGSATKDVFLISKGFRIIKSKEFKTGYGECFAYGSKVELGDIYFDTGGGATNAAFSFKNLGLKTSVVTRVGQDDTAEEIENLLKKKKIDTKNIVQDKREKTAYSTILLTLEGERTILVYRGVSDDFLVNDFKWNRLKTKWFYISSLGGNLGVIKAIFKFAKKNQIKIAWNPGSKELDFMKRDLLPLVNQSELLILNREEAAILTGRPATNLIQIFRELNEHKMTYWSVSDGKNGAYVSDKGRVMASTGLKVNAVNATGAGDAFGSALTYSLIKNKSLKESLQLAVLNGAGVVTEMGAKNGLLEKNPSKNRLNQVKVRELE